MHGAGSVPELQHLLDERSGELLTRLECPVTGTSVREAWEAERVLLRSLPSMAEPFELNSRVRSTAVLPTYSCWLRSRPASSMDQKPRAPGPAPSPTRAWKTGSPSSRLAAKSPGFDEEW